MRDDYSVLLDCESSTMRVAFVPSFSGPWDGEFANVRSNAEILRSLREIVRSSVYTTMAMDPRLAQANRKAFYRRVAALQVIR